MERELEGTSWQAVGVKNPIKSIKNGLSFYRYMVTLP
jgi:hypothetical protein